MLMITKWQIILTPHQADWQRERGGDDLLGPLAGEDGEEAEHHHRQPGQPRLAPVDVPDLLGRLAW